MDSSWKAISDDNRKEILLPLKKKDLILTKIAEHFNFTLPAISSHLRILKDARLNNRTHRRKKQVLFIE